MSITFNAKTYTLKSKVGSTNTFNGPANTLSSKDILEIKAIDPKPTKDFHGVARPSAKLVRKNAAGDESNIGMVGSIAASSTPAEIQALKDDFEALVALAAIDSLCLSLTKPE